MSDENANAAAMDVKGMEGRARGIVEQIMSVKRQIADLAAGLPPGVRGMAGRSLDRLDEGYFWLTQAVGTYSAMAESQDAAVRQMAEGGGKVVQGDFGAPPKDTPSVGAPPKDTPSVGDPSEKAPRQE